MLDSKLREEFEDVKRVIRTYTPNTNQINPVYALWFFLLMATLNLHIYCNSVRFKEIKAEIRELKNPVVSAEISVDKPTE